MTDAIAAKPASFDMGRVISRTFEALGANLPVFAGLALLFSALPDAIIAALSLNADPLAASLWQSTSSIVSLFTAAVLQAAVVHGSIVFFGGAKANFRDCLNTAGRVFLPVIGISFLVGLGIVLGTLVFIVPGLMLATAWAVSVPARVVEGPGVIAAIKRSAALTKGHRWPIFGLFVIVAIVVVVAIVIVVGVATVALGATNPISTILLEPVVGAAASLLGASGAAALYQELRTLKEGATPASLAAVFD